MAKVCIVMATYNGEKYLAQMLDSLAVQTRSADFIVIVDDGSTDTTKSILQEYQGKLPLHVFASETNEGHRRAFSKALELSKKFIGPEDLVALSDQDDIWLPQKLETLEKEIGKSALVFGDAQVIGSDGKVFAESWRELAHIPETLDFKARLAGTNNITGCLSLFKASLLDEILPIPEGVGVHDAWIGLAAAKKGGIKSIDCAIAQYRIHESNAVGLGNRYTFDETQKRQEKWSKCLLDHADLLEMTESEIQFTQTLYRYWSRRKTAFILPEYLFWIFNQRLNLFPSPVGRLKKCLFSLLGEKAVHLLFGNDK